MLGDHHPKEVLNIIHEGKHYGWPYCYESQVLDNDFGISFDCSKTEVPAYTFTAHGSTWAFLLSKRNAPKTL